MVNFPYFQVKFDRQGNCTNIATVFVSEEDFEELVQRCFGETQEEILREAKNPVVSGNKGRAFLKFLDKRRIDFKLESIKKCLPKMASTQVTTSKLY